MQQITHIFFEGESPTLSMAFAFLGSFVIILKILSRRVYETERET